MTIQYKNKGFTLTTTSTVSVLTANTSSTVLVKQIQASNGSGSSAISLVTQVTATSASATFRIGNQAIAASSTTDIINQTLVLEAGDVIKMTTGTANEIQGIISYAQLDRSQENG